MSYQGWWEWMERGTDGHRWQQPFGWRVQELTRMTRMPAFWGYSPPPHDYPYYWVILDPKSTEDKVKVTKLKNLPKFQIFDFWNKHYTHLLKLLDKICKYEMDPTNIVEDTGRTRFCPQTDRRTRWNQYTPLSTSLKRGYKNLYTTNSLKLQRLLPFCRNKINKIQGVTTVLFIICVINICACESVSYAAPNRSHQNMMNGVSFSFA